jgi:hypothetical protein
MAHYLSAHPDVFMADKEPTYRPFIADLHFRQKFHFVSSDERHYLSLFRGATTEKWLLDATPLYMYSADSAVKIRAFSPDAKIIIILRNPVAMMYSMHGMNLGIYTEDLASFEEALAAEPERRLGRRLSKYLSLTETVFYRSWANYTAQVERYFNVFGRENVRVMVFDDFVSDTPSVFRETLQFLEIDDTFAPQFRVANAAAEHSKARAFLAIHPVLRTVVSYMPAPVRRLGTKLVEPLLPPLTLQEKLEPEVRNRLLAEFEPEVERLERLLDRKLVNWYSASAATLAGDSTAPAGSNESV